MVRTLSAALAVSLLLCSAAQAEWASFSDARGTSVQFEPLASWRVAAAVAKGAEKEVPP